MSHGYTHQPHAYVQGVLSAPPSTPQFLEKLVAIRFMHVEV